MPTYTSYNSGNYSSGTKDANGFWLTGGFTETVNIAANTTSITNASYVLNHASAGMFSQWTLTTYLRVEYSVDGGATQYLYLDPSSSIQWSMPNTTLTLGSGKSGTIPNNSDGTCTYKVFAWCDANTNATYVPVNTDASRTVTITRVPRARKFVSGTPSYMNTYKRYDAATSSWVDITTRKVYNAATSSWVDLGSR